MSKRTSRSSLFLMELIMSILFFSLSAAVCVQLFVQSHVLSKSSVELNHAVVECQSMAEFIYGSNADPKACSIMYAYDEDFNKEIVTEIPKDSAYLLICKKDGDDAFGKPVKYNISFVNQSDNRVVYSISPTYYQKGGAYK